MILERKHFVIKKEGDIIEFIKHLSGYTNLSKSALLEKSKFSQGATFDNILTDSISLTFITNGKGYTLSDLGNNILQNKESRDLWKKAYSNVFLYSQYLEEFINNSDYNNFIRYVYSRFEIPRKLRKFLGMGIRRFFEGYFQVDLPPKIKQPKIRLKRFKLNTQKEVAIIPKIVEESNHIQKNADDDVLWLIDILTKANEKFTKDAITKYLEKV